MNKTAKQRDKRKCCFSMRKRKKILLEIYLYTYFKSEVTSLKFQGRKILQKGKEEKRRENIGKIKIE